MALSVLVLTACGQVPQPFSRPDGGINPLADPVATPAAAAASNAGSPEKQDSSGLNKTGPGIPLMRGLAVSPVEGAPAPRPLAEAVAGALGEAGIAAFVSPAEAVGIKGSPRLSGTIESSENGRGFTRLRFRWIITGNGPPLAVQDERLVPGAAWRQAGDAILERVAVSAAQTIAVGLGLVSPAVAAPPRIAVVAVDGAPGDGDASLRRMMVHELRGAGLAAEDTASPAASDLSLLGEVDIRAAAPGTETVTVAWTLLSPDGKSLGTARQESRIAAGTLNGAWGPTALAVARAAAPAIAAIARTWRAGASAPPS